MNGTEIDSFSLIPVDIPLTDDFVISQGKVSIAQNIYVTIKLRNGVTGLGEITPFPELSGEDRSGCMHKAGETAKTITGKKVTAYRSLCGLITEITPSHPSVRCGFETAVLDALCRSFNLPLHEFFGGSKTGPFQTDITIPILSRERSLQLAGQWYERGFRKIKMKAGKDPDREAGLILEIFDRHRQVQFIIDANQGFTPDEAIKFARVMEKNNIPVIMFEQPVNKNDIEGLAHVKKLIPFPVTADESVFSPEDLRKVIHKKAADIINLKIMKTGLLNTLYIAVTAYTMGLQLMIGGMVETRVAMGTSLALVAGTGIIDHLDLDTPLLMAGDPVEGGYSYKGPEMYLSPDPGLGMTIKE